MNDEGESLRKEDFECRIFELERHVAELSQFSEELNAVVIGQDKRVMRLEQQVQKLLNALKQGSGEYGSPAGDERPPHY